MMDVFAYLDKHNINYILHRHPAVFTCEETATHCAKIPGLACKNLLLRNKKKTRFFLYVLGADERVDMKLLGDTFGAKKLSFASPECLFDQLALTPGAVSPFGLLNNTEQTVALCISKKVHEADIVSFHPNDNTATLELTHAMFVKYLHSLPHTVHITD